MVEVDITTHVVLVLAAIEKDGKYLLARRSKNDPQAGGQWSFPGGKVDLQTGEGIIEKTLKKEIDEEVGITIGDEMKLISNDGFVRVSGHHVLSLFFLCKYESGEAQPLEDHDDVKWMTLEELLISKNLPPYTMRRVRTLQKYFNAQQKGSLRVINSIER